MAAGVSRSSILHTHLYFRSEVSHFIKAKAFKKCSFTYWADDWKYFQTNSVHLLSLSSFPVIVKLTNECIIQQVNTTFSSLFAVLSMQSYTGSLETWSACQETLGTRQDTLDMVLTLSRGESGTHSHTSITDIIMDNFEIPIRLQCKSLNWERKPECPSTGRTRNLNAHRLDIKAEPPNTKPA